MPTFVAPGRVNLMGDHTDYNDGFCLPVAIDRYCEVTVSPPGSLSPSNTDYNDGFALPVAIDRACSVRSGPPTTLDLIRATSQQVAGAVEVPLGADVDPGRVEPAWGRFVAGAVRALHEAGVVVPACDLEVDTTVPIGSGLSSSSALAVAVTGALGGNALEPLTLARTASRAETIATGVRGGLMDQLASVFGRAGHALLIDCRTTTITPVVIPPSIAMLVVHCGVPRTLVGSEYAARRAQCEAIAAALGITALRDATPEQVQDHPRARHVVAENDRVLAAADALPRGDLSVLGPLLLASHASLRDDFGVSTPELDTLVDVLVSSGAAGARLSGAGFGGCVVGLVQRNHADDVLAKATLRYRAATGIEPMGFVARATGGAHRLD